MTDSRDKFNPQCRYQRFIDLPWKTSSPKADKMTLALESGKVQWKKGESKL